MRLTSLWTQYVLLPFLCLSSLFLSAQMAWQSTSYTEATKINDFLSWGDSLYAATSNHGIQMTHDQGQSWQALNSGLSKLNVQALVRKDSLLFAGTLGQGVFVSSNRGQNWQPVSDSLLYSSVLALLVRQGRLLAGTQHGIYYSDNNGDSWQAASLPPRKAHHRMIFCLAANANKIIGGTSDYVYESQDNGTSWIQYKVPTDFGVFTATNYQGDILLGTGGDGLLYPTTGTGYSADPAVIQLDGVHLQALYADGVNLLSSIATAGVFFNHIAMNEGLEGDAIHVSEFTSHQGELYAGTFKDGIWKYALIPPPELEQAVEPRVSTESLLHWTDLQVLPNPAGGDKEVVQLLYHLPQEGRIRLALYHETGQHIATLIDRFELQGDYQTSFDISGLQNGNYYFALHLKQSIIAQPLFLIR